VTVLHGDCLAVLPTLDAASVDAIVCDPPYGLSFMGKNWDHGIPGVAFWVAALRVAKPGAYLVAAGGTRTFHRLACAIEDAGWEMRDCLSWLYGSGFPKGKACLKPAWEPFLLARKPAKRGTHLQVAACRIGTSKDGDPNRFVGTHKSQTTYAQDAWSKEHFRGQPVNNNVGRWPANVVLSHSPACNGSCEESCAVRLLDEQSGERKSAYPGNQAAADAIRGKQYGRPNDADVLGGGSIGNRVNGLYSDTGGASRFFYTAKASRREREAGLEGMPERKGRECYDPAYHEGGGEDAAPRTNNHPTVKPLALMRWLCRLVTPPGGLILDPFTGSGSTGCAAVLEGFRFLGIEREPEYVAIAERRIAHWAAQRQGGQPELGVA
jgi:DNA modification methylase